MHLATRAISRRFGDAAATLHRGEARGAGHLHMKFLQHLDGQCQVALGQDVVGVLGLLLLRTRTGRYFVRIHGRGHMSKRAVAYVQGCCLSNPDATRVFLTLAERTAPSSLDDSESPMGLLLDDADIPVLAAGLGINADRFRSLLRELRDLVPMDVLEHRDGTWEIVYGPSYTNQKPPQPRPVQDGDDIGSVNAFTMPGWENYSTWGLDRPLGRADLGHLYAQLYLNCDDPNASPRIWITPPKYVLTTLDELAQAIAAEIAPYAPVRIPPEVIRIWLVR